MLHIIGLGLRGTGSITRSQDEILKKCDSILFESYTSVSPSNTILEIEKLYGKTVESVDRPRVEDSSGILDLARSRDVCLLVTGDPLNATTHNQIRLDAIKAGIGVEILENSSILTVLPGKVGLSPYRMGPPVSLPFITERFRPRSVLEKIKHNLDNSMHTLLLLDLKDGRTMYPHEALAILQSLEDSFSTGVIGADSMIIIASRISQVGENIIFGKFSDLKKMVVEGSPSSLVVLSPPSEKEMEFIRAFCREIH